jgi:glutaryl-CoA dehydrogenase
MPPDQGVDFFRLDDLFSDEERLVRDTIRKFVTDRVNPIIGDHFEAATFPGELIPQLAELGIFGANLPEQYGCAGMNSVAYGLMMQELEAGDSAVRSFASVQTALVMHPIYAYGSRDQKETWLPRLARGEVIGCFGLTEPDHGSDPAGMTTRASPKNRSWILNGAKCWITNGSLADIAIVWAKDDSNRVQGFIVEAGRPGFETHDIKRKLSLRASITSELTFNDVEIPEENRLPGTAGLRSALECLDQARYGIAWGAIGVAMACYDWARRYTLERIQFDRPIASFQLVQEKLADSLGGITQGQLLAWRLGKLKDAGESSYAQTSLAKRNNVRVALQTARIARDLMGANGVTLEYPVFRHMVNMESVYTYEGTDHMHTLILGEAITGIPAFR